MLLLRGDALASARLARAALAADSASVRAALCLAETGESAGSGPAAPASAGKRAHLARDLDTAILNYRAAAAACRARGDAPGALAAELELGSALRDAGRWREGAPLFRACLEEASRRERPLESIAARYGLAYCLTGAAANAEARALAASARRDALALDLPLLLGECEYLLGALEVFDFDLEKALVHQRASLAAYERARHPRRQVTMMRQLAATWAQRGEIPRAVAELRRAEALARESGEPVEASYCLEHLGTMHHALGDEELGLREWRAALAEGGASWPPEWRAGTLTNIAAHRAAIGDAEGALAELEAASAALDEGESRRGQADLLVIMARVERGRGRVEAALARASQAERHAREWRMPLAECRAVCERGECERARGRPAEAGRAFAEAARLSRGRGFWEIDVAAQAGLARAARARGDTAAALARYEEALGAAEGIRAHARDASRAQRALFGRSRDLFDEAVEFLAALHERSPEAGFDRRAFEVAQRAKARTFLDLLEESRLDLRLARGPEVRRRERSILDRMRALAPAGGGELELRRLEDELLALEAEVRREEPRLAAMRYPVPCGGRTLQESVLAPDELLAEFHLGERASFLWLVTPRSFRMVRLAPREALEREAGDLLLLLSDCNLTGDEARYFAPPARRLYRSLFGAGGAPLGEARRLVVSPDGLLHYLPFEALLTDDPPSAPGRRPRYGELPYLLNLAEVSYIPSASALAALRAAAPPPPRDRPRRELLFLRAPSPGTVEEGRELARRFRGDAVVLLDGSRATCEALAEETGAASFRFVHLAAHGVFNERRPELSGLALAPGGTPGDDGFLSTHDALALALDCELVTLSACSSARGEQVSGEGLTGLTRAFLHAGSRHVAATLWDVSGTGMAALAGLFYQELTREPSASPARALAAAKRRALADPGLAHPFFWAPLVLTGL